MLYRFISSCCRVHRKSEFKNDNELGIAQLNQNLQNQDVTEGPICTLIKYNPPPPALLVACNSDSQERILTSLLALYIFFQLNCISKRTYMNSYKPNTVNRFISDLTAITYILHYLYNSYAIRGLYK